MAKSCPQLLARAPRLSSQVAALSGCWAVGVFLDDIVKRALANLGQKVVGFSVIRRELRGWIADASLPFLSVEIRSSLSRICSVPPSGSCGRHRIAATPPWKCSSLTHFPEITCCVMICFQFCFKSRTNACPRRPFPVLHGSSFHVFAHFVEPLDDSVSAVRPRSFPFPTATVGR